MASSYRHCPAIPPCLVGEVVGRAGDNARMSGEVGFALAALAVILLAQPLSQRLRIPGAVVLVVVGVVYGLLPGPNVVLSPTLVLTLILPPLLYSAALQASLLEIRSNLRTVGSLSVGLVLATSFAVAGLVWAVVPGLPFALAVALGAAVAPTDPVAALAIGRRLGLPARLVTLVEGEGLLNDATALTTYQVAVAVAVGGHFSAGLAVGRFALDVAVGLVAGLVVAGAVRVARRHIEDPLVDNGLSLGVPFICYVGADAAHGSGVLAVVVAGLILGHQSAGATPAAARLQTRAVWRLVDFLLAGFIFLLIGQQLHRVAGGLNSYSTGVLLSAVSVTVGAVLVLRPLWLAVGSHLPSRWRTGSAVLGVRDIAALSWTGTRGVISLAAIFGLPLSVDSQPLPDRDLLVLCTYAVVLVTLIGQGLTFAPLLRWLGLPTGAAEERRMRSQARLAAARAGSARLEELTEHTTLPVETVSQLRRAATTLEQRHLTSLAALDVDDESELASRDAELARLRRLLIDAERDELLRWRDAGRLSDRSLRILERELDLRESRQLGP